MKRCHLLREQMGSLEVRIGNRAGERERIKVTKYKTSTIQQQFLQTNSWIGCRWDGAHLMERNFQL